MTIAAFVRTVAVSVLAALLYEESSVACTLPQLPLVPERVSDAVGVLREVARYDESMARYRECESADLAAAGGDTAPQLVRATLVTQHNKAVAEYQAVMSAYAARVGPIGTLPFARYLGGESQDCIVPSAVRGGVTVNDGAVLFHARGDRAFLNILDDVCPGLARKSRFLIAFRDGGVGDSGSFSGMRVCDYDSAVSYVDDLSRAQGCDLGRFFPLSPEQVAEIMDVAAKGGAGGAGSGAR